MTVRADSDPAPINPADGWRIRAQIRDRAESPVVLHTWDSVTTPATAQVILGAVVLAVPAAVSSAWTWERGVYDLELVRTVNGVEQPHRLIEGLVRVSREVTRPTT